MIILADNSITTWNLILLAVNILMWVANIAYTIYTNRQRSKERLEDKIDFYKKVGILKIQYSNNQELVFLKVINKSEFLIDKINVKIEIQYKLRESGDFLKLKQFDWIIDESIEPKDEKSNSRDKEISSKYFEELEKRKLIKIYYNTFPAGLDEESGEIIEYEHKVVNCFCDFTLKFIIDIKYYISKSELPLKKIFFVDFNTFVPDEDPSEFYETNKVNFDTNIREFDGIIEDEQIPAKIKIKRKILDIIKKRS